MAKRGPKPAPTALKILAGVREDRVNSAEPTAQGSPSPPAWLKDEALEEWRRISPQLVSLGVVGKIDEAALAVYCLTYSQWLEAEEKIKEFGAVVATASGGVKINPWVTIANKLKSDMLKFLSEFGLTPSSRSRLSINPPESKDELAEFLKRRKA